MKENKEISPDHLREMLRNGEVSFSFSKKDGTRREARGTLSEDLIPINKIPKKKDYTVSEEPMVTNVRFFDLDFQGWRSMCYDCSTIELNVK